MQTVTISQKEYERLKQIEQELDASLEQAISDIRNGRI